MRCAQYFGSYSRLGSLAVAAMLLSGCCLDACSGWFGRGGGGPGGSGPAYDRPFPLGASSDAFWETQQTNAEAAKFIFHDHEFEGETARLTPGGKRHLVQVALRLEHVPFPVVIEQSLHNAKPELDRARRRTVIEQLARLGVPDPERRVVIAPSFAEGFSSMEGEQAYYRGLSDSHAVGGARFGGRGGTYR